VTSTAEIQYSRADSTIENHHLVSEEQSWFWSPEWQESIERSLAQSARGEGTQFSSGEDFLAALDE
jgi:hypothetical protein